MCMTERESFFQAKKGVCSFLKMADLKTLQRYVTAPCKPSFLSVSSTMLYGKASDPPPQRRCVTGE